MAVRAVRRRAVRSVSLLLSDPEDLGRFVDELAACRRRGHRPAGPVDDGESGGRFDLVEHLRHGAGAVWLGGWAVPRPGGWTVEVLQLAVCERLRIRHHGYYIADATVHRSPDADWQFCTARTRAGVAESSHSAHNVRVRGLGREGCGLSLMSRIIVSPVRSVAGWPVRAQPAGRQGCAGPQR